MANISVVIITYNEEEILENTIRSAKRLTDDLVVVDSFSTDRTVDIAKFYGARIFQRRWEGYYKQKNFGNNQAKNDFVLSLDADEVLTDELVKSIRYEMDNPQYEAYKFKRSDILFGRKLLFGAQKNKKVVRLFNKNKVDWGRAYINENPETEGIKVGLLQGELLHHTSKSVESYLQKGNEHTSLYAQQLLDRNRKATLWKLYLSPIFNFTYNYIFRLGFLDGFEGYFYARQNSNNVYLKYSKLKVLQRSKNK